MVDFKIPDINMTMLTLKWHEIFNATKTAVNSQLEGFEPWYIVFVTLSTVFVCHWLYSFLFDHDVSFLRRCKRRFFYIVKRLPVIKSVIEKHLSEVKKKMSASELFKLKPGMTYMQELPQSGCSKRALMAKICEYRSLDTVNWTNGKVSGTVYCGDPLLTTITAEVYHKFAWTNPLHADVFPALRKMEAEIVRMCCSLFNGHPIKSCGSVSSGGTESILLACKTYRDWAYDKGITKPEMICPVTAHAAFEKAAHYFRIRLIHIPVDPVTRKADVNAMRKAITRNTCMLVGSTPPYPHGVLDPIEEISNLGLKYGIPVHVDACLGGFLLPFMGEAGFPIPPFDFRLKGVTSISADTHKYGYAPKGSSVVLYCSRKWINYQYFVSPDWQGGIYATPMFAGSRSGAIVAACWATLVHIGRKGYIERTRKIITTARYIEEGLRRIPHIFVFGKPEMSVIGFGSLDFDIFRLSSALVQRGWNLNSLQFPASIHICITLPHTQPGIADCLVRDIEESVCEIMKVPLAKVTGAGAMYGMAQALPDRSIVSELASEFLHSYYDARDYCIANGSCE